MIPRITRPAVLLAVLASSWLCSAMAFRGPSELSNSFIITSLQDLQPTHIRGASMTPCEYAVQRARSLDQKHFSIVVTAYWAGDTSGVHHYCFKDVSSRYPEGYGFPEPDVNNVQLWKYGLQRCFRAAVNAGFSGLQILNHIDSQDGSQWRNFLPVDPSAKYRGWSYEDIVVRPASEALRSVIKPSTRVWFMLSGEMGHSIFKHPVSYLKLMSKYRGVLAEGKAHGTVKMGVALHWNKVCGDCFDMPHVNSHQLYNTTYHQVFESRRAEIERTFDIPMIRRVFETTDAIGLSHYAPAPSTGLNAGSFSMPIDTAAYELAHWGIDLKGLLAGGKDFLFSEVGLGGGSSDGRAAATSVVELALNPLNGIWAVYNTAQDPWRNADFKTYRRQWFKSLMTFLYGGGGPRYKVDAAFIWSVGTFDVAAIHPISTSTEGTYADWEVVKWMRWLSSKDHLICFPGCFPLPHTVRQENHTYCKVVACQRCDDLAHFMEAPEQWPRSPVPAQAPAPSPEPASIEGWRTVRARYLEAAGKLQKCRADNDRLLRELKAYRKHAEDKQRELQEALQRAGTADRLVARLADADREAAEAAAALRAAKVEAMEACQREQALRGALKHLPQLSVALEEQRSAKSGADAQVADAQRQLEAAERGREEAAGLRAQAEAALQSARGEAAALAAQLAQRGRDFDSLLAEQREGAAQLEAARRELAEARRQAVTDQEGLAGLSNQVAALRDQAAQSGQAAEAASAAQREVQGQLSDLRARAEEVAAAKSAAEAAAAAAEQRAHELEARASAAEAALQAARDAGDAAAPAVAAVRLATAEAAAAEAREELAAMAEEVATLRAQQTGGASEAAEALQHAQQQATDAEARAAEADAARGALSTELEAAKQQAAEAAEALQQAQKQATDAEARAAEADAARGALSTELEAAKQQAAEAAGALQQAQKHATDAEARAAEADAARGALSAELDAAKQQAAETSEALQQAQQEAVDAAASAADAAKTKAAAEAAVADVEARAAAAEAELEAARAEAAGAGAAVSAAEELARDAQQAAEAARRELQGAVREAQAEKMRQVLAAADRDRKTQLAQGLRASLEEAQARLAALAEVEGGLRAQLQERTSAADELRGQLAALEAAAAAATAEAAQLRAAAEAPRPEVAELAEARAALAALEAGAAAEQGAAAKWRDEASRSAEDRDELLAQVQKMQGQLDEAKRVGRQEARDRENAAVERDMARAALACSQQAVEELKAQLAQLRPPSTPPSTRPASSASDIPSAAPAPAPPPSSAVRSRQPGASGARGGGGDDAGVSLNAQLPLGPMPSRDADDGGGGEAAVGAGGSPAAQLPAASGCGSSGPGLSPPWTPAAAPEAAEAAAGPCDVASVRRPPPPPAAAAGPIAALSQLAALAGQFSSGESMEAAVRDALAPAEGVNGGAERAAGGAAAAGAEQQVEGGAASSAGSASAAEGASDDEGGGSEGGASSGGASAVSAAGSGASGSRSGGRAAVPRLNLARLPQLATARDRDDEAAADAAAAAKYAAEGGAGGGPGRVQLLPPVARRAAAAAPAASRSGAGSGAASAGGGAGGGAASAAARTASVGEAFELPGLVSDGEEGGGGTPVASGAASPAPVGQLAQGASPGEDGALASPTGAWLRAGAAAAQGGAASSTDTPAPGDGSHSVGALGGEGGDEGGDEGGGEGEGEDEGEDEGEAFYTATRGPAPPPRLDQQSDQDQEPAQFFTCAPATGGAKAARTGHATAAATAAEDAAPVEGEGSEGQGESATPAAPAASEVEDTPAALRALCRTLDFDEGGDEGGA
ncbi:MAG: hypothetical protein J3K34DRAFT_462714 [Monoraphidium minutum]|nr:MAG: hypothetical protein J3K34DRAFT_462714 [Monoraphidium minutum]